MSSRILRAYSAESMGRDARLMGEFDGECALAVVGVGTTVFGTDGTVGVAVAVAGGPPSQDWFESSKEPKSTTQIEPVWPTPITVHEALSMFSRWPAVEPSKREKALWADPVRAMFSPAPDEA